MKIAMIHVNLREDLADTSALGPTRRNLVAVWLIAIRDRATSVCLTYENEQSYLSYEVDQRWQESVLVPELAGGFVGREIWHWINPSPFRRMVANGLRRLARRFDYEYMHSRSYPFLLVVDTVWSIWGVTICEAEGRERVTFEILECTDWARDQASRISGFWPSASVDDCGGG